MGGGAVPVGAAAGDGLVPGLDVEVLPAGVEAELEAEVLPPSPVLWKHHQTVAVTESGRMEHEGRNMIKPHFCAVFMTR